MTDQSLPWDVPESWEPARAKARAGGTLMVLGQSDSGKSTLAAILAHAAFAAGRAVAVVDADMGQASIGPPACVSLARVTQPIPSLSDLAAERLDFVGSPSPVGHLLGSVTSAHAMVQAARAGGAETLIVDTTGLISGQIARALKGAKVRLLAPDVLVALQVEDEVEPLLAAYRHRPRPEVLRLRPSRRAKERTRTDRTAYRQRRFAAYFGRGQVHGLDWKQVPMENTSWTTGEPLPGHLQAHAEGLLGQEVRYAERTAEGLLLLTAGPVNRTGLREIEDAFGPVHAAEVSVFDHLLVGLLGDRGETLALGIVERIDFAARRVEVYTPLPDAASVRAMRLGFIQVARDGTQLAWLNATDIG